MRAPFCRYLKLLNATHIRKVACVAGGTVMPRVRSWRRRPRGIWLVPNIYAAQPPKNYNSRPLIPPATQAIGKLHGKERSRSKDLRSNLGIYPETFLPCSLIGRNKEGFRHHQEPTRTSGRKKVCRIPRWDATCDYVLCRLSCSPEKNCSSEISSAIEASLFNGQLHSGDTKFAVLDICSQNLCFWYLYSQNICLGPEGVSWIVGTGIRVRIIGARADRRSVPCLKYTYRNFCLTVSIQDSGLSNSRADSTATRIRLV